MEHYSNRELTDIWIAFWQSKGIEPDYRNVPTGVTPSQWLAMVYNELCERGCIVSLSQLSQDNLVQLELAIGE